MAENTKIEWATHTFNPWEGCQKVGPGCDHCYAETRNARFGTPKGQPPIAKNWGPGAPRRRTSAANWRKPLAWNAEAARTGVRPRVFCASLADVFDNEVDDDWRDDLAILIIATPHLDWLLLTKRIGNAEAMLEQMFGPGIVPANLWLGATIVNQAEADRDIPKLLAVPAAKRFLSMEPLLGPVDLGLQRGWCRACGQITSGSIEGHCTDPSSECFAGEVALDAWLHWIIVGGESGPGARPMHPDWARSLRDQCAEAGVPFLFKQWGEWAPGECATNPVTRTEQVADLVGDSWHFSSITPRMAEDLHRDDEPDLWRMGKKAAGRWLDGVQHDGVPS